MRKIAAGLATSLGGAAEPPSRIGDCATGTSGAERVSQA